MDPAHAQRRVVVALVRHGDYHQPKGVPSARLPHPLTDKGLEQARGLWPRIADELRDHALELHPTVDCSSLLRASQTASTFAAEASAALDRPVGIQEHLELGERSVGSAANLSVERITEVIAADPRHPPLPPGWKSHPRFRLPLPGAESLMMAGARVAAHVERRVHELRHADPGGPPLLLLVVSHGAALRHCAVCLGTLDLDEVPGLSMHHCGYVLIEHSPTPSSHVGRWQKIGGAWKIRPAAKALD